MSRFCVRAEPHSWKPSAQWDEGVFYCERCGLIRYDPGNGKLTAAQAAKIRPKKGRTVAAELAHHLAHEPKRRKAQATLVVPAISLRPNPVIPARRGRPDQKPTLIIRSKGHAEKVRALWEKFGPGCFYCRRPLTELEAVLDHYVPRSRGGSDGLHNRRVACWWCDQQKGDLLPSEFEQARRSIGA